MKEKLINVFGTLGFIIYYLGSWIVYILPFVMIGAPFWLDLILFGIVQFFPLSSIIFWIWGLICAIQGVQDIWAIIYYILFVIMFVPFFISTLLNTLSSLRHRSKKNIEEIDPYDEF